MTTPQPIPLLTCPFCASQPEPRSVYEGEDPMKHVRCASQACPIHYCVMTPEQWNRRAPAPGLRIGAEVERRLLENPKLALDVARLSGREYFAGLFTPDGRISQAHGCASTPQAALDALEARLQEEAAQPAAEGRR